MKIKEKDLGTHFLDKYQLGEYIGHGGNGTVYKVFRKYDNSSFALKYLTKASTNEWTEKQEARFKDEIKILGRLSELKNPYTMPLIDHNTTDDGLYWYVMPIGITLSEFFIKEEIDINGKLSYFIDIAKGIKSIHDLDCCHRDIKPNNILIVEGKIKLADFGLAWHPSFDHHTKDDECVGARETIAPEMREKDLELKHSSKADIYSFVKTIWMLILARNRAFAGQYSYVTNDYLSSSMEIFRHDKIKTVARLNDLIMRGTEYLPINRPSIYEVINELELFIEDNILSENEIREINHKELVKINLHRIESDVESITNCDKIRNFLNGMLKENAYTLRTELFDGSYDAKFTVKRTQATDIENGIIFESIDNRKYLLIVSNLDITKQNSRMCLSVNGIKIENIPKSIIYNYKDFYSKSVAANLYCQKTDGVNCPQIDATGDKNIWEGENQDNSPWTTLFTIWSSIILCPFLAP